MSEKAQAAAVCDVSEDCDIVEFRRVCESPRGAHDEFEQQRALAVAASLDGLWEWDLERGVLHYSDRCAELLGYGKGEIPHTIDFFWNALLPEDVATARAAVSRCLEDNTPADVEYRLRTKNGEYRWFWARGQAQRDAMGQASTMAGVLQDITDRKRVEEALEERLRFENLLADLSATFVNVPSEGLGETIDSSLKTLVQFLGNDRSTLVRLTGDKKHVLVTHCYVP